MDTTLVGAFKLKDGLFIGDEFAAQDLEFVVANKVTRIINCASRQIPNHWEPIGVHYLSFGWFDTESQIILDTNDKNFSSIFQFIEHGLEHGESVLIHSVRGISRCVCIATAYFIKKYQWSLYKSLEFVAFRRPDICINSGFLSQLANFEARIVRNTKIPRSDQWASSENPEELVLTNTFLNSRLGATTDYHLDRSDRLKNYKIRFSDNNLPSDDKSRNKTEDGFVVIKSCLKGMGKTETKVPVFNAEIVKARTRYSRENLMKNKNEIDKMKIRSTSLNKGDKLVKEAMVAARNMIVFNDPIGKNAAKTQVSGRNGRKFDKDPVVKIARPITAPQKRPLSPKVNDVKAKTATQLKGSSFGSIKKAKNTYN